MIASEVKNILRHKSAPEQKRFRTYFQNLNVQHSLVSAEPSETYNAVSWSLGITNQWLWPGNSLAEFDAFYTSLGFMKSSTGIMAIYGHHPNNITHVAKLADDDSNFWESKCGADLRIRHQLTELNGDCYGKPLVFYKPGPDFIRHNIDGGYFGPADISISAQNLSDLRKRIAEVPKKTMLDFEKNFEDWRNTWFAGRLAVNSNPLSRGHCIELFKLLKMGKPITPLVVQKMLEKNNFFVSQLYDRLRGSTDVVEEKAQPRYFIESEQSITLKKIAGYLQNPD